MRPSLVVSHREKLLQALCVLLRVGTLLNISLGPDAIQSSNKNENGQTHPITTDEDKTQGWGPPWNKTLKREVKASETSDLLLYLIGKENLLSLPSVSQSTQPLPPFNTKSRASPVEPGRLLRIKELIIKELGTKMSIVSCVSFYYIQVLLSW